MGFSLKMPNAFSLTSSSPGYSLPSLGNLTTMASTALNTAFTNQLANLPAKLLGNNQVSKLLGPYVQEVLYNFLGSSVDQNSALGQGIARLDPMMSFSWVCLMPTLPGNVALPASMVEDIDAPFATINAQTFIRGGKEIKVSGKQDISDLSVSFYEDNAGNSAQYIERWRQLIRDDNGNFGIPSPTTASGYYKPISVYVLGPNSRVLLELIFLDCWPTTRESYRYSGENDRIKLTHTFSCNDFIINANPSQLYPGK